MEPTVNPLSLTGLSDHDRRWLVHVFWALSGAIEDAIECEATPFHDAEVFDDDGKRCNRLGDYVRSEIAACMTRVHAEEAEKVFNGD
jgi:hypothetical protein